MLITSKVFELEPWNLKRAILKALSRSMQKIELLADLGKFSSLSLQDASMPFIFSASRTRKRSVKGHLVAGSLKFGCKMYLGSTIFVILLLVTTVTSSNHTQVKQIRWQQVLWYYIYYLAHKYIDKVGISCFTDIKSMRKTSKTYYILSIALLDFTNYLGMDFLSILTQMFCINAWLLYPPYMFFETYLWQILCAPLCFICNANDSMGPKLTKKM